ncbi:MAG: DUF3795 domain-containing protein [Armatimonadota bacterium]|nr:DUF3795 domain-containing protein [bacterium]
MDNKLIGACGLVCSECEGYKATQANDPDAIAKIAADWSKQFGADIKPESVQCDGCMTASDRKCGHCAECEIRACVISRGLPNCAHCEDYGCETISNFLKMAPCAEKSLSEIRAGM